MWAWAALLGAGLLEVIWAAGLKQVSWARPFSLIMLLVPLAGSMALLIAAARTIPIGTAYAVWTGIGAVGAALVGMYFFGEPASLPRFLCIGLIVAGVIGLRLFA